MIKSITNFINGSVYTTGETNRQIELSDGKKYNKKYFHTMRGVVSSFIRREVDLEPAMQELRRATIEKHKEAERILQQANNKLAKMAPNKELFYLSDILMPFGKYKGRKLSYIAADDISYYNWLFDTTNFEPYGLRNLSRTPNLTINLDSSSKKDDELPF